MSRDHPGGAQRHAQVLQGEGVDVQQRGGLWYVDFGSVGWFPEVLPSEEGQEGLEGEGEDREEE